MRRIKVLGLGDLGLEKPLQLRELNFEHPGGCLWLGRRLGLGRRLHRWLLGGWLVGHHLGGGLREKLAHQGIGS